jgi:hypothetical protein
MSTRADAFRASAVSNPWSDRQSDERHLSARCNVVSFAKATARQERVELLHRKTNAAFHGDAPNPKDQAPRKLTKAQRRLQSNDE